MIATIYSMSWVNVDRLLVALLVFIPTKRSILIYCLAQNWYTIVHIWYLVPMKNIWKGIPTHGWYWNSWGMWCLWMELALFHVAKKDGQVRHISDLHSFNNCIKYKQYLLPLVHNVVQGISGYKYFTKLDILMKYFSFELDEESHELCEIITSFGQILLYMLNNGPKMRSWFWLTNYGTGPSWAW